MRFSWPSPLKMPTTVMQDVASAQAPANGLQTYGPISCFWSDTPFARNKQQLMQQQGTFPGLTHDLSDICQQGVPKFWARSPSDEDPGYHSSSSSERVAAKRNRLQEVVWIDGLLEHGIGELVAEVSWPLRCAHLTCFEVVEAEAQAKPFRQFPLAIFQGTRFFAASDAAQEDQKISGGPNDFFSARTPTSPAHAGQRGLGE